MDTLDFVPSQFSDAPLLLLMAAHDMNDALKHPHPCVPFTKIGDGKITALAHLSAILKNKFQKPLEPEISHSSIKVAENKHPSALIRQMLTSPAKHNYQTRLQPQVNPTSSANVMESQNLPQLWRVVTPAARSAAPPRVPVRTRNFSPRNLSHEDFLDMGSANQAIALGNTHWTNMTMVNAVIHPVT
jgi:hypothetical protein